MSCKITFDNQGNKKGVLENNELFQQILNNPNTKDFDDAIQIFKQTYSDKVDIPRVKTQDSGFYSNAEQSLLNLKDKNPKNVKGWISQLTDTQKNGGIKNVNQELEWIGLEDYLNEYVKENNPKAGNIPSSVVEDYIKSNQIEIVDVNKTTNKPRITEEDIIDAYEYNGDNGWVIRVDFEDGAYVDVTSEETEDIEEAKKIAVSEYNLSIPVLNTKGDTKYLGYQLKGASNYREVLLTMPSKRTDITEAQKVLEEASLGNLSYDSQEVKDAQKTIDRYNSENKDEYSSSHWSEKNILAHLRLNEKTLPDGRRVLILNEIQSDSGQAIKKDEDFILKEIENNFDNIYNKLLKSGIIKEDC